VASIEAGFLLDEIEQAAYAYAKSIDDDERIIVGLNKFVDAEPESAEVFPIDPELQRQQAARVTSLKTSRDQAQVDALLGDVRDAARGSQNLMYPIKEALRNRVTLGEVSDALRDVFGVYAPTR
jgi:methylmalonyl-CoA mutase N-terminal domain/subunit